MQILVIVAISEMELFTPDEPNGLFATVFGEQLAGPKPKPSGFREIIWSYGKRETCKNSGAGVKA